MITEVKGVDNNCNCGNKTVIALIVDKGIPG